MTLYHIPPNPKSAQNHIFHLFVIDTGTFFASRRVVLLGKIKDDPPIMSGIRQVPILQ